MKLFLVFISAVLIDSKIFDGPLSKESIELFEKHHLGNERSVTDKEAIDQLISDLNEQEMVIRAALDDDKEQPLPKPTKPHLLAEYNLIKSMESFDKPTAQLLEKLRKISGGSMKKSFFEGIVAEQNAKLEEIEDLLHQSIDLLAAHWQIPKGELWQMEENCGDKLGEGKALVELANHWVEYGHEHLQNWKKSKGKRHNFGRGGKREKRMLQLIRALANDAVVGLRADSNRRKQRRRKKRLDQEEKWCTVVGILILTLGLIVSIISRQCSSSSANDSPEGYDLEEACQDDNGFQEDEAYHQNDEDAFPAR